MAGGAPAGGNGPSKLVDADHGPGCTSAAEIDAVATFCAFDRPRISGCPVMLSSWMCVGPVLAAVAVSRVDSGGTW